VAPLSFGQENSHSAAAFPTFHSTSLCCTDIVRSCVAQKDGSATRQIESKVVTLRLIASGGILNNAADSCRRKRLSILRRAQYELLLRFSSHLRDVFRRTYSISKLWQTMRSKFCGDCQQQILSCCCTPDVGRAKE
jgi:hypothetical protein